MEKSKRNKGKKEKKKYQLFKGKRKLKEGQILIDDRISTLEYIRPLHSSLLDDPFLNVLPQDI